MLILYSTTCIQSAPNKFGQRKQVTKQMYQTILQTLTAWKTQQLQADTSSCACFEVFSINETSCFVKKISM